MVIPLHKTAVLKQIHLLQLVTVADGTKSTATTADGTKITDGTKNKYFTADSTVIDDGNGNNTALY